MRRARRSAVIAACAVLAGGAHGAGATTVPPAPDRSELETPADALVASTLEGTDTTAVPEQPEKVPENATAETDAGTKAKPWGPGSGTVTRSAPVLMVHGFELGGASDCTKWNTMASLFSGWGHPTMVRLRFYDGDTGCDHNISHHGSHDRHYGGVGHRGDGHTQNADIRHLAYHLAWYINDHWGSVSNVDVVAHSMGGLLLRYALWRTSVGDPDFPATLMVQDAVTLGTPHLGTYQATGCAYWKDYTQCRQMSPGSAFLKDLESYAQNPQGYPETDWTLVGSEDDHTVSEGSATGMKSQHKVLYGDGRGHSSYRERSGTAGTRVKWDEGWDGKDYFHWDDAPDIINWADRATAASAW